jgi:hypothetical protein
MIGLSRLKRAIEDLPTGGMQTGDPKVRLKLCDAQRLEVEFNAIIAERDNAFAQNAELVAKRNELLSLIYNSAIGQVCMNYHVDAESLARSAFEITGIDANQIRSWEK